MSKAALLTAFTAICSVITLQIGAVPITLGIFAILFSAVAAGRKISVVSTIIYILIGICGLPVFSGFGGGISALAGPTGGYITAYVFMALIVGTVSDKSKKTHIRFFACILALCVCYFFGTFRYCILTKRNFRECMAVCVLPFVPFDILKCAFAAIFGGKIGRLAN